MTERLSEESLPPEIRESLDQADRDLAEGNTRDLSEVLAEIDAERKASTELESDIDIDGLADQGNQWT
jgi:hypothetical protein